MGSVHRKEGLYGVEKKGLNLVQAYSNPNTGEVEVGSVGGREDAKKVQ